MGRLLLSVWLTVVVCLVFYGRARKPQTAVRTYQVDDWSYRVYQRSTMLKQESKKQESKKQASKTQESKEDNGPKMSSIACDDLSNLVKDDDLRCKLASEACETEGFINYLEFYHCQSPAVVWPCLLLLLLVLIHLLGDVAERYFCPALDVISDWLELAPAVAGPTLLAFGNGAPDISSSLIGLVANESAQDLGLSSPLGSGIFVTSVVFAAVLLISEVKVEPWPFFRDAGFYLCSIVALWATIADGLVFYYEAWGMVLLYFAYVSVVIFGDKFLEKIYFKEHGDETTPLTFGFGDAADPSEQNESTKSLPFSRTPPGIQLQLELNNSMDIENSESPKESLHPALITRSYAESGRSGQRKMSAMSACDVAHRSPSFCSASSGVHPEHTFFLQALYSERVPPFVKTGLYRYYKFRYRSQAKHNLYHAGSSREALRDHSVCRPKSGKEDVVGFSPLESLCEIISEEAKWEDSSWLERICFMFMLPIQLIILSTVPPTDTPDSGTPWRKIWAVSSPICAPLLILAANGWGGPNEYAVTLAIGLLLSTLVYYSTLAHTPPSWALVFALGAFFMSIFWMYIVANEVMELLEAIGVMLEITQSILAVTVLAWGNCIGDLAADTAMAKQGFATTAVGAIFGGPVLPLLVGLGSAFIYQAYANYPAFRLGLMKDDVAFCFWILTAVILASMIVIPVYRFQPPRAFGFVLLGLYTMFMACMIAYERNLLNFHWLPFEDTYCAGHHCELPPTS